MLIRRVIAAALILTALLLTLAGTNEPMVRVVRYREAVTPGTAVPATALEEISLPKRHAPPGLATDPSELTGLIAIVERTPGMLASPLDVVDPSETAQNVGNAIAGAQMHIVPLKLADPQVALLLHHGDEVSVITPESEVIAAGGRVLFSSAEQPGLVLIALPADDAHVVASAALNTPLAVVLTGARAQ